MKKYDISQYLMIVLTGFLISCTSPTELELDPDRSLPQNNTYIVEEYVTQDGKPQVSQTVYLYIKDYQYTRHQTTFTCVTNFQGFYRFTVTYNDWNYILASLSTSGIYKNIKIRFGKVARVDFEL